MASEASTRESRSGGVAIHPGIASLAGRTVESFWQGMTKLRLRVKRILRRGVEALWRQSLVWRLGIEYRLYGLEAATLMLMRCRSADIAPILRRYGANIATDCDLNTPLVVHHAPLDYANLMIGPGCHLGKEVFLDLCAPILIEDRVTIAMRAMLLTHTDVGSSPLADYGFARSQAPVVVRRGAYIGAGATVLPGVTLGECSVVGAGAVVVHDVPAFTVVAGVPARQLRTIAPARMGPGPL